MNRRDFLHCAAVLVSGASGFSSVALSQEQRDFIASRQDYVKSPVSLFSEEQREMCAIICEHIIPATDTPGAIDANVPSFVELMVSDWYTNSERSVFLAGLSSVEQRSQQHHQQSFAVLDGEDQIQILKELEASAADSVWYAPGRRSSETMNDVPFICQIKELTTFGFFTSKLGATGVLRYNPMPMRFDGAIPLEEDDSSWAFQIVG
ncbi:gluconate 2-dehydrogenase subunit 3 family protein [Congregibacter brevis]|uniref:Gluconate 2-dehydrogenase subunit 3 family protein n=1 Tax=Congregibacter brevis TaxID=3081201 RepID=A0ABZ0IGF2_9GAMM|nr:gluconate 2-dehydrogenase subunit 3 family protein [Congregibacter sp. IMCC45268]